MIGRHDHLVARIRRSLSRDGYHYEPGFCNREMTMQEREKIIVALANRLGRLYLPTDQPVIVTSPASEAPEWKPFDRAESIGWHNDFSTKADKPRFSLSWIVHEDPGGLDNGAWRLASAEKVIARVREYEGGPALLAEMSGDRVPFGYCDGGDVSYFRMLELDNDGQFAGLRFYGRALRDGAALESGAAGRALVAKVIVAVEQAADEVGVKCAAVTGALLVVDNWRSLHDRLQQTTEGKLPLRTAILCFAESLLCLEASK